MTDNKTETKQYFSMQQIADEIGITKAYLQHLLKKDEIPRESVRIGEKLPIRGWTEEQVQEIKRLFDENGSFIGSKKN